MPEKANNVNGDVIEKLLIEKFGQLYDWKMPVISKTVGPYSPEIFTSFEVRCTELINECKIVLEKIATPDLAILFHPEFDDPDGKRSAWKDLYMSEINSLSRQKPSWMSGGFGHPDFIADFQYWGQMASYQLDEALILSVGIEPKHFNENFLDRITEKIDQDRLHPALEYLIRRRTQFRRHFPSGFDGWLSIKPRALKTWFDEILLDVHKDFYSELERRYPKFQNKVVKINKQDISPQERETLLKLIAAMAIRGYSFDPSSPKNSATKDIQSDLDHLGIRLRTH